MAFDMKGRLSAMRPSKYHKATRKPAGTLRPPDRPSRISSGVFHSGYRAKKVEADDIIGSLARRFAADGLKVLIVSGDKDLMQLVNDHIVMVDTMKEVIYDVEAVRKRFGVEPDKVVEILGLMGDTSDNIPGVPGIGPKGALRLIEQFGTIEAIINNPEKSITPKPGKHPPVCRPGKDEPGPGHHRHPMSPWKSTLPRCGTMNRTAVSSSIFSRNARFSSRPGDEGEEGNPEGNYSLVRRSRISPPWLKNSGIFRLSLDFILTSPEPMRAEMAGLAVCPEPGMPCIFPFSKPISRRKTPGERPS